MYPKNCCELSSMKYLLNVEVDDSITNEFLRIQEQVIMFRHCNGIIVFHWKQDIRPIIQGIPTDITRHKIQSFFLRQYQFSASKSDWIPHIIAKDRNITW